MGVLACHRRLIEVERLQPLVGSLGLPPRLDAWGEVDESDEHTHERDDEKE